MMNEMNELDKLRLEYESEFPLIMGFREIGFEVWLCKQLIDIRHQVKNIDVIGNVSISACTKCMGLDMDVKFNHIGTKIYWGEHHEIGNIEKFTLNDRYYTADRINKECLIYKCKTCGYKKAVDVAEC